jgi:hypothetical protein
VDAAGRQGLPTGPLLGKAGEGAAKGVAAAEVVRALELYAVDVGRASELMGAASSAADLTAAADALRRGVPEEAVVQLAPVLSGVGRTLSLVALGDLVGDGVPAEPAFDLVHLAGGRDAAAEILPVVPLVVRQLVRQGWAAADAALQVEDAIARGRPPPFVELGALGGGGKPPVPPGTGAPGMMGGMMGPGGG